MNTIGYFEIQSLNPSEAIAFYEHVFGWKFERDMMIPIEYYRIHGAGAMGGLLIQPAKKKIVEQGTNAFCCSIQVENFDEIEKKILEKGGLIALPKMAIIGKCWQGYFLDTDRNVFGIFEIDVNAK